MSEEVIRGKKNVIRALIEQSSCNNMNCCTIAEDLKTHTLGIKSIKLKSNGHWFDTLEIEPDCNWEELFMLLGHEWKADEIHWKDMKKHKPFIHANSSMIIPPFERYALRLWWD